MSALIDALRRKYRSPADALRALGFNPREFGVYEPPRGAAADRAHARDMAFDSVELADGPGMRYPAAHAADKGEAEMARFTRSRRYAYDDAEENAQELLDVVRDPESSFGEMLAAVIEHAAERDPEEVYEAMREMSEDKRGFRSWARDRLERRHLSRDARRHGRDRRRGYDQPPKFEGRPTTGAEGEDRRRMTGDAMPFDRSPRAEFARMFGEHAAKIERG